LFSLAADIIILLLGGYTVIEMSNFSHQRKGLFVHCVFVPWKHGSLVINTTSS